MDLILREADVMCVALRVGNPGVLTRVQSALKAQGVSAEWYPRERLHCTLLTSDIPDDATARAILRGMSLPLAFSTEGVRVEAWGDYLVLVLDPCPALPRIQTDIFNRALALGLEVSSYAPPGIYRPHITLGLYPRGSLDGLDGFPTDNLWFEDVVVWNGDYRQVDATRLPKEAGDRLFVEVSGMTRRLVARGGPGSGHFGHEGRPGEVGGSQPGDFHSAESPSVPKSIEWHHPEAAQLSEDFSPLLYHGTVREHIEDIARFGLLPQVGEWVTSAYSRPGTNIGKAKVEATYFAGPEGAYGYPEQGISDVENDSYAWKAILAIQAQVGFLMDKAPKDVSVDDIRSNGLLVGVKASDLIGADVSVVGEDFPEDGDEPTYASRPVSFPDDETVDVAYTDQPLSGVGPETGDYFTTSKVQPSMYLYGDNLVRWMAHFFDRYREGEGVQYDLSADIIDRLGRQYSDRLMDDDAVLDDFPPEDEEGAVEASMTRRVATGTPVGEFPARRIFIPEWLIIARGGPGSGHFDHAGRPGEVGGSQPGDFHGAEDKAKGRVWWGEARDGAYAKAKEMRLNGQFAEVVGGPNPDNPDRPYEVITDRDIFIEEWGRERATDRNEAFSAITKTGLLALRDDGRRYLVGDNKRIVIPDDVFASIVKQGKRDQEIVVIHNHPPNDDDPSTMESPPSPTDIASVQYMHNVYGERKIGQGASLGFPVTGIVTTDRGTYRFTMNRSFSDSENQTAERFLEMGCERVPTPDQFAALSESERLVAQVSLYKNLDAAWRKVADAFPGVFTYRYEQRPE
jgi:hypothetical protein